MANTSTEEILGQMRVRENRIASEPLMGFVNRCFDQQAMPEIAKQHWREELAQAARAQPFPVMDVVVRLGNDTENRIAALEESHKWLLKVAYCNMTLQSETIANRFHALLSRWKSERGHRSFIRDLCTHEAYQQIIGLGPAVVPLLLAEFEKSPGHYDWALRAITGVNPVAAESRGKLKEMAAAWVAWGKQQGLEW